MLNVMSYIMPLERKRERKREGERKGQGDGGSNATVGRISPLIYYSVDVQPFMLQVRGSTNVSEIFLRAGITSTAATSRNGNPTNSHPGPIRVEGSFEMDATGSRRLSFTEVISIFFNLARGVCGGGALT